MALDSETHDTIESLIKNSNVVLFMKGTPQQPQCGFSASTISTLNMLVPDYMTINVLDHPQIRDGIKEYSNWPTIPQLYIGGELIGGNDIVQDMLKSGELADVLGIEAPRTTTPEIRVGETAIDVMKSALQSQAGSHLHLQISAGWDHSLNLDRAKTSAVQVDVGGI
jgi:monothiol glutaredoxin